MAFTAAQVEASDPDGWTGKTTSIVYETLATVEAYLELAGYTGYTGVASEATRQKHLRRVTIDCEDAIRNKVRGKQNTEGQGLLYPGGGYYISTGKLLQTDEAPREYLEGIRIAYDLKCAGTWLAMPSGSAAIKSESTRSGRTEYRDGVSPSSIKAQHPEVWAKIRTAIPRLI